MFKLQISTQTEHHKQRKYVATDKNCILWKMDLKFPNPKFNSILNSIYFFDIKQEPSWVKIPMNPL